MMRNLYRRALEISEKALGPDHPQTRTIRNNYDRFKSRDQDDEEALAKTPPCDDLPNRISDSPSSPPSALAKDGETETERPCVSKPDERSSLIGDGITPRYGAPPETPGGERRPTAQFSQNPARKPVDGGPQLMEALAGSAELDCLYK